MSARRLTAVPDAPRRAVLYVRVSALMGREGERFHSPDLQVEAMRALAARNGLVEVDVVQDIDRSGRTFAREGIQHVMHLAREHAFDVLAVYDLSRLGRNTSETLKHVKELRALHVHVVSTVERIDDGPEGEFQLGLWLGLAQLYSDQMGRKWQQIIERRARQGLWHGSIPPLGYQLVPGQGLVPDPILAPVIAQAFERYAAGHRTLLLARWFSDQRGVITRPNFLKRILRNPVYVGRLRVGTELVPARHEAVVDEVTWERVQKRMERDARTPARTLAISHSLVGLVFCDECGERLQLHRDKAARASWLQCHRRMYGGAHACQGPGTPAQAKVEAAVLDYLPMLIDRLERNDSDRAAKQAARSRAGVDAGRLRRAIADTESALARLAADRARRAVSQTAYDLGAAELEREVKVLRAQLDEADRVAESPAPRVAIREAKAMLKAWPGMTTEERNRMMRLLLRQVRVRRAAYRGEPMSERVEVFGIGE